MKAVGTAGACAAPHHPLRAALVEGVLGEMQYFRPVPGIAPLVMPLAECTTGLVQSQGIPQHLAVSWGGWASGTEVKSWEQDHGITQLTHGTYPRSAGHVTIILSDPEYKHT